MDGESEYVSRMAIRMSICKISYVLLTQFDIIALEFSPNLQFPSNSDGSQSVSSLNLSTGKDPGVTYDWIVKSLINDAFSRLVLGLYIVRGFCPAFKVRIRPTHAWRQRYQNRQSRWFPGRKLPRRFHLGSWNVCLSGGLSN